MIAAFLALVLVSAGDYPGFVPPPNGTGDEILAASPRSFAMGGISAGLRDPVRFPLLNPAASGWALESGICLGGRYAEGDAEAWSGFLGFPNASLVIPLPWNLTLTGAIASRSRLLESADRIFEDYKGRIEWSGGLEESYAGVTFRGTDWLAVSLGGRCTFGSIVADVTLTPFDPGPPVPVNTVYRDDASLGQAWGGQLGLMIGTPAVSLGFSVTTDREGIVDVRRDYSGEGSDSLSMAYEIPGEIAAGASVRPVGWLLVGADVFTRKALNLLGSRMEGGSVVALGMEADLGSGFAARAGYNRMHGLWRDSARTLTAGGGYAFDGGHGGIDVAAGFQSWTDSLGADRGETVFSFSLWATESWLGE